MESSPPRAARIRALPLPLANQIAAGEVVERPASVVKELLENSLDAGARRIEVEIEAGGTRLIRVRDDGHGIHRQDLPLAVGRHATSKIARPEDLAAIASLGFRGEALASIAAVSRLSISSALADERGGWTLSVDAASAMPDDVQPVAHPPGTTVEVRDLLHNTPARRKFLRTDKTEFGHIDELMRRVALSHFDTALALQHNRREVHQLPAAMDAAARERRLVRLCGRAFVEAARRIDFHAPGLQLWGWIGGPDYSRGQADLQYFYVNGRIIRDRVVAHALRQAYQPHLYPGRHPAYVLHLVVDAGAVDVNVHPTKHEVRFREARRVHDFLVHSVGEALRGAPDAPRDPRRADAGGAVHDCAPAAGETAGVYRMPRGAAADAGRAVTAGDTGRLGQAVAVLHDTYLLAHASEGPLLVDIGAAQSFIARRALRAALADGPVPSRPLLVPCRVSLSAEQADAAEAHCDTLAGLGVALDRIGPQTLLVRALPTALEASAVRAEARVESLVRALFAALEGSAPEDEAATREAMLSVLAEHARRPAGELSSGERQSLLRALEAQLPGTPQAGSDDVPVVRDETGHVLSAVLPAHWLARLFD